MAFTDQDVGKTCPFCNKGKLVKSPKSGKVFCAEKCWLNKEQQGNAAPRVEEKPNWDEISKGKVRHGVAVAFIGQGKEYNQETIKEMDKWVGYIMKGSFLPEGKIDEIQVSDIPF